MEMFFVTLVLLNILYLPVNGNLCSDDVISKLMSRLDAQQSQIEEQRRHMDAQQLQIDEQQRHMDARQRQIDEQQRHMDAQQRRIDEQQRFMDAQQRQNDEQQRLMDAQQRQIDLLQDAVNKQQTEDLQSHIQAQNDDHIVETAETTKTMNDGDNVPKLRRKRQLPNEGTVAFTAVLKQVSDHLGLKQNIVFDTVETNVGNAYNVHHGVFVAPVPGIYVFHTTIFTQPHHLAYCRIVVNGVGKASVYVQGGSVSNAGSQTIVANLNKGDDVAVQAMDQADYVFSNGNFYSTFSGFLLQDLTEMSTGGIVG